MQLANVWVPPLIWMALMFPFASDRLSLNGLSHALVPVLAWLFPDRGPQQIELLYGDARNMGHVIEYAVLAALYFRTFRGDSRQRWNWRWVVYPGAIAIGYGAFDEVAQQFVITRTASASDFMLDVVGAVTVLAALTLLNRPPAGAHHEG